MFAVEVELHVLHGEGVFLFVKLVQGPPALLFLFFGPRQIFPLGEEGFLLRLHLGLEFLVPEKEALDLLLRGFLFLLRRPAPFQVFLNFPAALGKRLVGFLADPPGPFRF
jgi:hypothetical protein